MLQKVADPVSFLEARWNQCRWPLWKDDAEPKLVCGARTVPGKSYCCEHRERSLRRPSHVAELFPAAPAAGSAGKERFRAPASGARGSTGVRPASLESVS